MNHSKGHISAASVAGFSILAILLSLLMSGRHVLGGLDRYTGVVVQLDIDNHSLLVMNPRTGVRARFSIREKTAVMENESTKDITDLVPGTLVIVDYEQSGEQYAARRISIQPASK